MDVNHYPAPSIDCLALAERLVGKDEYTISSALQFVRSVRDTYMAHDDYSRWSNAQSAAIWAESLRDRGVEVDGTLWWVRIGGTEQVAA